MPAIVQVNVSITSAPLPETLQETGALVSLGGTNTSPGTITPLTQFSDLTPFLATPAAVSAITWLDDVVTVTTTEPHGLIQGDSPYLTMAAFTPAAFNGTYECTVTGASSFTYPLPTNPGAETALGTYVSASLSELTAMATTFFAQGSGIGCYVLEFGTLGVDNAVSALNAYLIQNPNTSYTPGAQGFFYIYLVPRSFDGNTNYLALLANYNSPTSKTYFFTTTTLATYKAYPKLDKCCLALIEAPAYGVWPANALTAISWSGGVVTATTATAHGVIPGQWFQIAGVTPAGYNGWAKALLGTTGTTLLYALATNPGVESVLGTLIASAYPSTGIPATEFSLAADFQHVLNYTPSSTRKVTPNNNAFLFGVTPFPVRNNSALLSTLSTANISVVGTGAEGGISTATMSGGCTLDGNDFQIWYSIDWVQINADIDVSNEVINGANNPANPLFYNQPGINRLQARAAATVKTGVSYGLVFGGPVQTELVPNDLQTAMNAGTYAGASIVNADPLTDYVATNPDDYQARTYAGLTLVYTPQEGFAKIVFNVNVSFFPNQV
jgi:hypothetical protein